MHYDPTLRVIGNRPSFVGQATFRLRWNNAAFGGFGNGEAFRTALDRRRTASSPLQAPTTALMTSPDATARR
jgi:hypothetical protein